MVPRRPPSEQELLDEARRRVKLRRARRRRRAFWVTAATLVVVLAVVLPLTMLTGGGEKVTVGGRLGATTTPVTTSPGPTIGPGTRPHAQPSTTLAGRGTATTAGSAPPVPATTAPTTAGGSTTAPPATPTQGAQLAVVVCPTTIAIASPPPPASLPRTMQVQVGPAQASELAVYSDNQGRMKLVAPAGWRCVAQYGADGSGGVAVYPSGESVPADWGAGWPLSAGSPIEAVVGFETSACQGCTAGQACPLFPAAASAFQSEFGRPCPAVKPAAESTYPISAGLVAFEDPPGTVGDGRPSGGANPANSVMTYYPNATNGSWRDTCTLPADQRAICTTVLNNFIAGYGTS